MYTNPLYPCRDSHRLDNRSTFARITGSLQDEMLGGCLLKKSATKYMQPDTNYARTRTAFAVTQAPSASPTATVSK